MGRNRKEVKEDICKILNENDFITVGAIAKLLQCHSSTIRKNLREMRDGGFIIVPSVRGIKMLENGIIEDDDAAVIINAHKWAAGLFKSALEVGKMTGGQIHMAIQQLTNSNNITDEEADKLLKIYSMFSVSLQMIKTQREFDNQNSNMPTKEKQ
jgi:DNA-binding transcriptional regulator YhcF (GntR family)